MPIICDFNGLVKVVGAVVFIRTVLVMAGIEQNPGPKETFVFRYQYLLIEVGTEVLRKLFDNIVGNDFIRYLNANPTQYNQLKYLRNNDIITDAQKKFLPPDDMKPTSRNFDITLLVLLLRNVCGLCNRRDTVWNTPAPGDLCVEADITRLRGCRNNLMHRGTLVLPIAEFDDEWKELSGILIRLNGITGLSAMIDNARAMDIDEELKDRLDKTIKAWDTMDQDVISKIVRVEKMCADVKRDMKQGLSTVQQGLTTVQLDMSTVQQEVKQGLTTVQQEVSTVQQEVKQGFSTVQQEVSTVQQKVRQGLSSVQQEVSTMQQGLTTVQQEVKQGLSTVQQGLTTVQQEVSTVQQEVKQGLSTVQQGLTTVQENMKRLKRLPSEDANDIQEKLITIYQRDCRLLQVSPFIEDDSEDLMSIYQSPTLHTVYDKDQTKGKQEQISSYEEIFCKDDKTFTRVYITGDAGVGKTSLCRRMCLLWSKSRSGNYAGNDESTKRDIQFLEKFDFLFHVSLGATHRRDMIMIIIDQLFYTECEDERTDLYKLIKRILNQHDSLIVLDGFDEWNPKISGKHDCKTPKGIESEKCVFLTMCRPYKLESVRLLGNDIDHQIEMSGIHGLSSEHYVIEVVKYMNKKNHDSKNADQFLEEVKQCELYDQLCIPMISSHLVVVWWFNKN